MTAGVMRITRAEWKWGKTQQGWPKRSWCQTSWLCWLLAGGTGRPRPWKAADASGQLRRRRWVLWRHQQGRRSQAAPARDIPAPGSTRVDPLGLRTSLVCCGHLGFITDRRGSESCSQPTAGGPHPGCITQDRREASRPRDNVQTASNIFNRSGGRSDCWKSLMRTALSPSN